MTTAKKRVIPGFGLSMGITLSMLSIIVLIPMVSLVLQTAQLSVSEFVEIITRARTLSGYWVSFLCAFIASVINAVMGTVLAWVLVRYNFPGKRVLDGLIELPFALPTAIAGLALTSLCVDSGWVGRIFIRFGVEIAYTRIGITVAMIFIGIPFVVRAIQPVLEKLDVQYEEAAAILGAGRGTVFFRVIFPEIRPALLTGFSLAFARSLGEYGSVVFIAGNTPYKTEIAPLLIMSKLQQFDYSGATAISLVMLTAAFLILFVINIIQLRAARLTGE